MDDVRNESDEARSGNTGPQLRAMADAGDESPAEVLQYRVPYDEPSGPTATDIFKGTAAVGLMLLFLAIALSISVFLIEQWSTPEDTEYAVAAPAAVTLLLLLAAWLSYRGARDCFTGATRRRSIRAENKQWPNA